MQLASSSHPLGVAVQGSDKLDSLRYLFHLLELVLVSVNTLHRRNVDRKGLGASECIQANST